MRFVMADCFATFVVILITREIIFPVTGQCTTPSCDNRDPLMSIVDGIQQLKEELFHRLDKQDQTNHQLDASFEEMKGQHVTIMTSLQSLHEVFNASFEERKNQHGIVNKSMEAIDRRLLQQGQSIHKLLNASFQEMESQHDAILTSLQEVDRRRIEEHYIYIKQGQSIYELLNSSFLAINNQYDTVYNISLQAGDRCSREYDIYSKQFHSIHEILNQSFQEIRNHHDSVESRICMNQSQSIHELINASFHEIKNQHDTVLARFQAVDQRLKQHDVTMRIRTQNLWRLTNGTCDPASQVCDCSNLKASGFKTSGVYEVCVRHQTKQLCSNAFCDMETTNGASLVFQRRKDGSVNFNRTWAEYRDGFGNPDGEFWLGNEMLYLLTSKRKYKLRVDLEDWEGEKRYAEYANFSISSSADKYRLTVGRYSGNAGDSMYYNNGIQFSTFDADNDNSRGYSCAGMKGGAWWHDNCSHAYLNGIYHQRHQTVIISEGGVHWYYWKNSNYYSLKAAEMKLVPVA